MKAYVVKLDTTRVITAASKEEALKEAKQDFIECLQRGDGDFIIAEEWMDFTGNNGMFQ